MSDNLILLEIGLAGVHGSKPNCTIDYGTTDFPSLFHHLAEGGYTIDMSGPLSDDPGLAIISPTCDCRLPIGQIDRSNIEPDNIMLSALASQDGGYGLLAKLAEKVLANPSAHVGPFDYISPQALAEWWFDRGAVVGQRYLQSIVWRDGARTKIIEPA